jgi:hypothetical protein
MLRSIHLLAGLAVLGISVVVGAPAQQSRNPVSRLFRNAPDTANQPRTLPFSVYENGAPVPPVVLRPADQMSRQDQDLLANAESVIQEKAGFENLDFNQPGWTYQQIVCPALPNHLFVRYSRDDGTHQMSMFSVAIPRGGEGKSRIIPIVRRGYSLFSPAPINALTISAFNHIRQEESFETLPDWIGTGLCYAALTGGDPQVANATSGDPQNSDPSLMMEPTLNWHPDGQADIKFVAKSANSRLMLWVLNFDRKGILLKAQHTPAAVITVKPVPSSIDLPVADRSSAYNASDKH